MWIMMLGVPVLIDDCFLVRNWRQVRVALAWQQAVQPNLTAREYRQLRLALLAQVVADTPRLTQWFRRRKLAIIFLIGSLLMVYWGLWWQHWWLIRLLMAIVALVSALIIILARLKANKVMLTVRSDESAIRAYQLRAQPATMGVKSWRAYSQAVWVSYLVFSWLMILMTLTTIG
ncbi:hypothetical protein [Lactiplantibacillus fabifermentans]|nr:hypothetical protein [Lactiplantibacillus fabifermentans]